MKKIYVYIHISSWVGTERRFFDPYSPPPPLSARLSLGATILTQTSHRSELLHGTNLETCLRRDEHLYTSIESLRFYGNIHAVMSSFSINNCSLKLISTQFIDVLSHKPSLIRMMVQPVVSSKQTD